MKLAVIQHVRRDTASEDSAVLTSCIASARSRGASVALLPDLPWLSLDVIETIAASGSFAASLPAIDVLTAPRATPPADVPGRGVELTRTPLGMTAALTGDACLDPVVAHELALARPDAVVLRPGSESDLQAEAILELALGLSEAVSGLVLVADTDGAAGGEPGHGGSAIVSLGKINAEAHEGDDLLLCDMVMPVGQPDSRIPVPALPPILTQRLASHRGQKVAVDYPADLT